MAWPPWMNMFPIPNRFFFHFHDYFGECETTLNHHGHWRPQPLKLHMFFVRRGHDLIYANNIYFVYNISIYLCRDPPKLEFRVYGLGFITYKNSTATSPHEALAGHLGQERPPMYKSQHASQLPPTATTFPTGGTTCPSVANVGGYLEQKPVADKSPSWFVRSFCTLFLFVCVVFVDLGFLNLPLLI